MTTTDPTITAHGVTVTITRSAGSDGAPVVFVDTNGAVPENQDEQPAIRVYVNDDTVYVGAEFTSADEED